MRVGVSGESLPGYQLVEVDQLVKAFAPQAQAMFLEIATTAYTLDLTPEEYTKLQAQIEAHNSLREHKVSVFVAKETPDSGKTDALDIATPEA